MRFVKSILSAALSLLAMQSFAQTPLDALCGIFSSGTVQMDTEYHMDVRNMPVTGRSELLVQGSMYHMKGNGLEVFCNGDAVWTVDEASREVVVEPCGVSYDSYMANPLLLLSDLEAFFKIQSQKNTGNHFVYVLKAVRDFGVDQAELVLKQDGSVVSGKFTLDDGNVLSVKILSMKKAEERPASFFSPQRKFDSDWIVTDLR